MGICYSCLGLNRRDSQSDASRLLYDDPYSNHYGTLHPGGAHTNFQPNAEDIKREREALEAICQKAADSIIDIFALHPPPTYPTSPDAQQQYYRDLLTQVLATSEQEVSSSPTHLPSSQVSKQSQQSLVADENASVLPEDVDAENKGKGKRKDKIKTLDKSQKLYHNAGLDLVAIGVDKGAW